jgi:hypothetical protein
MMKICNKCGDEKEISEFYKNKRIKDGHSNSCISCEKHNSILYNNEYKKLNKIKTRTLKIQQPHKICMLCDSEKEMQVDRKRNGRIYYKDICTDCYKYFKKNYKYEYTEEKRNKKSEYYLENIEKIKQYSSNYKNENIEKIRESGRMYAKNNKEKRENYRKLNINRVRENANKRNKNLSELERLSKRIRSSICNSFREVGFSKRSKSLQILGLNTFDEFRLYIESKFEPWMSWENYGKYNGQLNYGWDLDHIIPISSAVTEEDIIKLNRFENFQPLCGYTNRHIKRNLLE